MIKNTTRRVSQATMHIAAALTDWLPIRPLSRGTQGGFATEVTGYRHGLQDDTRAPRRQDSLQVAAHTRTFKRAVLKHVTL